jgi:hypothetical protein
MVDDNNNNHHHNNSDCILCHLYIIFLILVFTGVSLLWILLTTINILPEIFKHGSSRYLINIFEEIL